MTRICIVQYFCQFLPKWYDKLVRIRKRIEIWWTKIAKQPLMCPSDDEKDAKSLDSHLALSWCDLISRSNWQFPTQLHWQITQFGSHLACFSVLSFLKLPCCRCPSWGLMQLKETENDELRKEPNIHRACSTQWAVRVWRVNQLCSVMDGHRWDTEPLLWFWFAVFLLLMKQCLRYPIPKNNTYSLSQLHVT